MYHFSSEHLIRSCPLPKSMFSHKSADNLTIKSSKFEPLSSLLKRNKKHLEYSIMEKMIESIGRQLHHLEMENKGISSFNLDDITVFYADATDATATATATATDLIRMMSQRQQMISFIQLFERFRRTIRDSEPQRF